MASDLPSVAGETVTTLLGQKSSAKRLFAAIVQKAIYEISIWACKILGETLVI